MLGLFWMLGLLRNEQYRCVRNEERLELQGLGHIFRNSDHVFSQKYSHPHSREVEEFWELRGRNAALWENVMSE